MDEFNVLETIRSEIHAEHTLISHRLSWYATSQSFLMTAFAVSWNNDHQLRGFFKYALPSLGMLLSIMALIGVACAILAQWHVIEIQSGVIEKLKKDRASNSSDESEKSLLDDYAKIACKNRRTGAYTHWFAMSPPIFIPFLFLFAWIAALYFSWNK